MISILGIHDEEEAERTKASREKTTPFNVDVYIDGKKVDTVITLGPPEEGTELESFEITRALEGRRVVNISFSGSVVFVTTESE